VQPADPETLRLVLASKAAEAAGRQERAIELSTLACAAGEASGDLAGQVCALRGMADLLSRSGRFEEAVATCERTMEVLGILGNEPEMCRALTTKAFALSELGLCEEALKNLAVAREIAERLGDATLQYWVQNRVGGVQNSLGHPADARTQLLAALALAQSLSDETRFAALNNLTDCCMSLIALLQERGEIARSVTLVAETIGHAEAALALARALAHPYKIAIALINFGVVRWLAGDTEGALETLAESRRLSAEHGYRSLELSARLHSAPIMLARGDASGAIELLEQCLVQAQEQGERPVERECLIQLADAHEAVGDFRSALHRHREFSALEQTIRSERSDVRARILAHQVELENARTEAAQARATSEVTWARNQMLEQDRLSLLSRAAELERHAHQDALTGLGNRRYLDAMLPRMLSSSVASGLKLCVAMLDIDHFKTVNDTYGHAVGDAVLQRIADVILNHSRADDLVARYGGEEFLFAFTNHGRKSAWAVCERLRRSIAAEDWATFGEGFVVTVSIGLAESVDNDTVESLTARADRQLYLAKASGRNRTRQSEPGIAVAGPDRKTLDPEHG